MPDFSGNIYQAKRKFWALAGQVYIYDQSGNPLCYVKQKMFKLKEDITAFTDESMSTPILTIKARQIIDFAAAYDIVDSSTGEKVGAIKRKGFKSIIKDEWLIMDPNDNVIAKLTESSGWSALASRLISLIPQKYVIMMPDSNELIAKINQKFTFFTHKFDADFSMDTQGKLNRKLGIGALIMLLLIEGRQR